MQLGKRIHYSVENKEKEAKLLAVRQAGRPLQLASQRGKGQGHLGEAYEFRELSDKKQKGEW